jgi:murein DD-endopeptidase MepM/ murein hydrolase activator NlpD
MTQSEQILSSAITTLTELRSTLGEAKSPPPDPSAAAVFDRFVRVLSFIEARLKGTDAALFAPNQFQQLPNQLTSLLSTFRNFLQSASQWQQLNSSLDQILVTLNQLPLVPAGGAAEPYTAALRDFMSLREQAVKQEEDRAAKMKTRVKELNEAANNVDKTLGDLKTQLDLQKNRLDQVIPAGQKQIGDVAAEELKRFIAAEQQRLDNFNKAEKERTDSAMKRAEGIEKVAKSTFEKIEAEFRSAMDKQNTATKKHVEEIVQKQKEAEKVVGVIVATAMSGHYHQIANNEQEFANSMRKWATAFFIGATALVVAVIIISEFGSSQLSWGAMAFRVALAAVIFIPAFYFAKESGNHRRTANRLRRIELELTALEPFLRDLPTDQRNEILKKKSDEYFGREVEQESDMGSLLSRYLMFGRFNKFLSQVRGLSESLRQK